MLVSFKGILNFVTLACLFSLDAIGKDVNEIDSKSITSQITCSIAESTSLMAKDLTGPLIDQQFTLLGKAKFSVLFWDIYESSLLTSDGQPPFSHLCQHALFEIDYLRDISKKELLDNTISQWRHLSLNEDEYVDFLPLLENIWLDINEGDRLSMLSQRDKTIFYLNRKNIGEIQSLTFAKTFLGIWLDKNTSEPKLRQQLLGDSI